MDERVLVCFGDSNTHGSPPWTGEPEPRYGPDVRWPGVLAAALGPSWRVHEEGLPGGRRCTRTRSRAGTCPGWPRCWARCCGGRRSGSASTSWTRPRTSARVRWTGSTSPRTPTGVWSRRSRRPCGSANPPKLPLPTRTAPAPETPTWCGWEAGKKPPRRGSHARSPR